MLRLNNDNENKTSIPLGLFSLPYWCKSYLVLTIFNLDIKQLYLELLPTSVIPKQKINSTIIIVQVKKIPFTAYTGTHIICLTTHTPSELTHVHYFNRQV